MIDAIARRVPRRVLDFAYRNRERPPFRWARSMMTRAMADAHRGRVIARGPLAGWRFAFEAADSKAIWMGMHEPAVQETLLDAVGPGDVVYDVGAHAGYFVLLAAKAAGETGRVYAFEPDPPNLELLRRNIALNGLQGRAWAVSSALGEAAGRGDIERGTQSGFSKVRVGGSGEVAVSSLDAEVYERGMPPPSLIMVDTEGAEAAILRGARRLIAERHPTWILEHHGDRDDLIAALRRSGYAVSDVDESHILARPA